MSSQQRLLALWEGAPAEDQDPQGLARRPPLQFEMDNLFIFVMSWARLTHRRCGSRCWTPGQPYPVLMMRFVALGYDSLIVACAMERMMCLRGLPGCFSAKRSNLALLSKTLFGFSFLSLLTCRANLCNCRFSTRVCCASGGVGSCGERSHKLNLY